jgi:DNA-binding LacI/PurR family transcriptional regulator
MNEKKSDSCSNYIQRTKRRAYPALVSLFVPRLDNPFFGELTEKITTRFNKGNVHVSISGMINRNIELVKMFSPSATIMVCQMDTDFINKVAVEDNIIGINCTFPEGMVFPSIEIDFRASYTELAERALSMGCRKFAFLTHREYEFQKAKFSHVREVLAKNGLHPVEPGGCNSFSDIKSFLSFASSKEKSVDVVFCEDDPTAVNLLAELAFSSINAGDLIVVGCDNTIPVSKLWTVEIDLDEIVEMTFKLYMQLMSQQIVTDKSVVRTKPVIRNA